MSKYLIALLNLIVLVNAPKVSAQHQAFETISAGAFLGYAATGNELLDRWDSKPSLQLSLQTPFYAGHLETGVRSTQFTNSPGFPGYSDFQSTFVYLGWGYDFALTDKLRVGPLLRFGNTFFSYDEAKLYTRPDVNWIYNFDTNESEFAYELLFRSVYRLSDNFSAYAEFTNNRTLTYHPVRLNYLSAGIIYTFSSPGWLKKVLK